MRGKQACRRGRGDEKREDQDIANGAHRNDHGGGDTQVQHDVEHNNGKPHGAGGFPVQAGGVELGAKSYDDGDNQCAHTGRDDDIAAGYAGERAEEKAGQRSTIAIGARDDHHA